MRILLVEDDALAAKYIERTLATQDYKCDGTALGEDAVELGKLYDYDLVILDAVLPDIDGFDVLRRLRASGVDTPVLILSGLTERREIVQGLRLGADDFMTKPFDKAELIARIQAIVRRSRGHAASIIRTGKLVVNLDSRMAEIEGRRLQLTGKEFEILELMSLRKGVSLTKNMFMNHLYGGMDEPDIKIIDVYVCKLRKKLASALGGDDYIKTDWGRGYMLQDPVTGTGTRSATKPLRRQTTTARRAA